jgi:hypothetical protein
MGIMGVCERVVSRAETREEKQNCRCKAELYEHVETGREEGKVEIQMFRIEHPFVVLSRVSI